MTMTGTSTRMRFRTTAIGAIAVAAVLGGCVTPAGARDGATTGSRAAAPATTQVANGARVSAQDWARMSHRSAHLRDRVSAEDWARMSHRSARVQMSAEDWARMSHRSADVLTVEARRAIEHR